MKRSRARLGRALVAVLAVAAAVAPTGSARTHGNAFPTLYVNYTMNCTFTLQDDSGQPVASIPPGTYQVEVTTPVMFRLVDTQGRPANDFTACKGLAQFQLTGPGVNLSTTLDAGCAAVSLLAATAFKAGSTYVAQDLNQPSVTRTSFTTLLTGSPDAPPNPSGNGTGTGTPSTDLLGGSDLATTKGALAASLTEAGKPELTRGGKVVSAIPAGRYRFTIIDKDPKSGFTLRSQGGSSVKRLTGGAFVGKHSVTVVLAAGKWTYGTSALTRTFVVTR